MSRFTLDSATEFLFGNCVLSLSAGLPYPYNVAPAAIPTTSKAKAADDFARAFAEAQLVISQRPPKGWIWPLFEIFKDDTTAPMRIVNSFIDSILEEAIAKKQSAEVGGEKDVDTDDKTLLDHLVQMTTGTPVYQQLNSLPD